MIPIVSAAKCLGSMMSRNNTDDTDVGVRNKTVSSMLVWQSMLVPYGEAMGKTAECPPLVYQPGQCAHGCQAVDEQPVIHVVEKSGDVHKRQFQWAGYSA